MPTVVFDKSLNVDRDELIKFFREQNVDMRVFFYPLSMLPMFEKVESNVVSYDIYYRALNLPSYFEIEDDQINFVTDKIIEFIGKK
jgi:perosamine synthetase